MNLIQTIERIDALITKKAPVSEIKPLLQSLQEAAEKTESDMAAVTKENAKLKAEIARSKPLDADPKPTDTCPYCNARSGILKEIRPTKHFELMGAKTGYYKCTNQKCGREYDHDMPG